MTPDRQAVVDQVETMRAQAEQLEAYAGSVAVKHHKRDQYRKQAMDLRANASRLEKRAEGET